MPIVKFILTRFTISFIGHAQINTVTNQRLVDTICVLHDIYKTRIAQFESEPVAAGKIIF